MDKEQFEVFEKAKAEAEAKATELTEKFKMEITPFMFWVEDQFVVGYMRQPDRLTKMRSIDMYSQSRTQAGDIILRSGLIHEESDKRILEEKPANDPFYLGAINFCLQFVEIAGEVLKKKKSGLSD